MTNAKKPEQEYTTHWWQNGFAWLAFGGPAIVVVASLATAYIAIQGKDTLVEEDYYQKGLDINKTLQSPPSAAELNAMEPALKARNHATTGVHPVNKP